MSDARFDLNDPRLTAYVLDELDSTDRSEVEQQMKECEETRCAVEAIRGMTEQLAEELQHEPTPSLTDEQRAAVEAETNIVGVRPGNSPSRRSSGWILATAGTALVAGLLVFLSSSRQQERNKNLSEVAVAQPKDAFAEEHLLAQTDGFGREEKVLMEFEEQVGSDDGDGLRQSASTSRVDSQPADEVNLGKLVTKEPSIVNGLKSEIESVRYPDLNVKIIPAPIQSTPQLIVGKSLNSQATPSRLKNLQQQGQTSHGTTTHHFPTTTYNHSTKAQRPEVLKENTKSLGRSRWGFKDAGLGNQNATDGRSYGITPQQNGAAAQYSGFKGIKGRGGEKKPDVDFYAAGTITRFSLGESLSVSGEERQKHDRLNYHFEQPDSESYAPIVENLFLYPHKEPLATFGIDVDTAAYSNVRRFLNEGRLPPPNAVRIEELINYFHYNDSQPSGADPFSVNLEAADCPWNPGHRLVRIGLKGKEIDRSERPSSNLVFLIDVSGSMKDNNKLPLVRAALELLAKQMTENDRITIVTYSGEAALKLDSTSGQNMETILTAIRGLRAGGSTNGEAGIKLAYAKAFENRIKDGANRVILCTDGDFNVGVSDDDELMQMVHKYANDSGVFLSIFGFGMGNLKDAKLEKLADKGNGHYGYIDNQSEAHKVFVEEMTGTLYTIAKDLKLQVEFNPAQVGAYRLIGYENRVMAAEDFDNDRKDAGDVGAGHSVTALFEIIPIDKLRQPVELKYQSVSRQKNEQVVKGAVENDINRELLTLFLRYKQPDGDKSVKREYPLVDLPNDSASPEPSRNLQWSAAVAAFGMVLRDSKYQGLANYDLIQELAQTAQGKDEKGRRKEFLELVRKAKKIQHPAIKVTSPLPEEPKSVEIGKDVLYWKSYKFSNTDLKKQSRAIQALYPKIKVEQGADSGEIKVFASKAIHNKLADLLPRLLN